MNKNYVLILFNIIKTAYLSPVELDSPIFIHFGCPEKKPGHSLNDTRVSKQNNFRMTYPFKKECYLTCKSTAEPKHT